MDAVTALTRALIGIDSVNPGLVPGAAGERAVAELLAARLADAGFAVELVPAPSDDRRQSLIAVHEGRASGRTVVLNGHLDTVGVEGMPDPFEARIVADERGDRLVGRGASDMKGGVAGLVVAAEELARGDAPGTLVVALVADEEDASLGATAVIDRLRERGIAADVCLIAEPTWLDLAVAHRGFALYAVVLDGRAAHSSQPELAVDVVAPMGRLLTELSRHDAALRSIRLHPLLPHGSLMATVARAGTAPFTVAARAEIAVERRTVPGEPTDVGLAEVKALLAVVRDEFAGVTASVERVVARAPWQADAEGPAAELSALLADARTDAAPARTGAPYWMESALWQEAGVPAVVCGPAGGGLHAIDEWVDLAQLRAFPAIVADAVGRFLRA